MQDHTQHGQDYIELTKSINKLFPENYKEILESKDISNLQLMKENSMSPALYIEYTEKSKIENKIVLGNNEIVEEIKSIFKV